MSVVGLVILAAGGSARLGAPKQLLQYEGRSLLRRAAETALASSCRPIVVVLGASLEDCRFQLESLPVSTVENPDWQAGMGASLRVGLERLLDEAPDALTAVVVMLCDQPLLSPATLDALVTEYQASDCRIVVSNYGGARGVPALFDRSLFPELLALTGPFGAKRILLRYPDQTRAVPFSGGAIDIDTPADVERLGREPPASK